MRDDDTDGLLPLSRLGVLGLAAWALIASVVATMLLAAAPRPPLAFDRGAWLWLRAWQVMAMACLAAYSLALVWGRVTRPIRWRIGLTVALLLWVSAAVIVWGTALGAADLALQPYPNVCAPCEDGTFPKWACLLVGCW